MTSGEFQLMGPTTLAPQQTLAINDERFWPAVSAVQAADFFFRIANRHKIDTALLQEAVVSIAIDVDAYADYDHASGAGALLHAHQRWQFFIAGRTPGRPEVQDHHLSAKLAELNLPVRVLHTEVRRGLADASRPRSMVAAGREQHGKRHRDHEKFAQL